MNKDIIIILYHIMKKLIDNIYMYKDAKMEM